MKIKLLLALIAILCLPYGRSLFATGEAEYQFSEPSANGPVFAVATTGDGHIWMGGYFNSVNGSVHSSESYASLSDTYYCLAVLNTNGTLDADFTFADFTNLEQTVNFVGSYYVSAIAVDASQGVVYAGFSPNGGYSSMAFIARFDPVPGQPGHWSLNPSFTQNTLNHLTGVIHSMAFGDEYLYVAANAHDITTGYTSPVGRFETSGALDTSYTLSSGWGTGPVLQVRYYPPGFAIEPGGPVTWDSFLLLSGAAGVGSATSLPYPPINSAVITCADMRDGADRAGCPASGEVLAGGASAPYQDYPPRSSYNGFEMHRYGGALQTPSISANTNSPADNGSNLSCIEALPDGGALIAGSFTRIHGAYVNNFAHVLPDGTVDPNFANTTGFGWVFGMDQEPDGKYLLCGEGAYTAPIFGGVWGWVERRGLLPSANVTFTSQPQPDSLVVYEGDSADFYAGASSWPGLLAQWKKDGNDLAGQTNTSLHLDNVTADDSGQYSLFARNQALCPLSALSSNATLTVLPAPPAPANDAFANAIALSGASATGVGTIRGATLDPGEEDALDVYQGRSVWWTWTAPFSGLANLDLSGCDFQAAIGIFTGNDASSLSVITNNYDYGQECECSGLLKEFEFNAVAGTTYRIAVGGAPNSGSLGNIIFDIGQSAHSWTQKNSATDDALYGVTVGNHRIVAVGDLNGLTTSTDGENWSAQTVSASSSFLNGATYAGGLFVATGDAGAIITSPDGLNWTEQNSGVDDGLWGVAHGNGLFVAAGDNGTIVTSPDGIAWTQQTNHLADWFNGITFNAGQFVAVGAYGEICSSPDGTNWTLQTSPVSDELWGVGSGQGQFVAVGDYGEVLTSPDGTNWTQQTSPVDDVTLYYVSYAAGHFVAVGGSGTILLSTDGTNWISDDSGLDDDLYAVSYYQNGSFVITGDNGVILLNQPLRLGVINRLAGNQIQFNFTGLSGSTAIIEATPTLSPPDWRPIATNLISHGVGAITDDPTNQSLFYRARLQ